MERIYVDTSALFALLDRDDGHHRQVRRCLEELAKRKPRLVTTSYVVVETSALVRRRLGQRVLRTMGDVVTRSMDILWVDEELHRRAWKQTVDAGRKGPGLVDWVGFIAMSDTGIATALAVDRHFRDRGIQVLPS